MKRFTYANVMSTLALFLALAGGTAMAATMLPRNSVGTMHLKKNAVTSAKVKDRSIRGSDVDAEQVQLRIGQSCPEGEAIRVVNAQGGVLCEVDDRGGSGGASPSGPAGGDLAGSFPNPTIRTQAVKSGHVADGSLTGADVANNTLTGDDVDEATLGRVPSALLGGWGRSGAITSCDPEGSTYAFCAATEIVSVPPGARALVIGHAQAYTDPESDEAAGYCHLSASSVGVISNSRQYFTTKKAYGGSDNGTLVGVTPVLPAGATAFAIECNEFTGGVRYADTSATVVLISGA